MDVIRVHSVTLNKEKCKGCTACIKNCPTEAIRVRDGKAQIIDEICIDCGECIRVCPYYAKIELTGRLNTKIVAENQAIEIPSNKGDLGQTKIVRNCQRTCNKS